MRENKEGTTREYAENIHDASQLLLGLINDILDFVLDIDENLPAVLRGDEIRIRQILNNFLVNAVKYTKKGSITLSVHGEYSSGEFELIMAVADTGIGIRQEDIPHLFDSFKRLDEKENRHIEGTGLGLNITKLLVDLMNGKITVESEYGKGSCFAASIHMISFSWII